VNGVTDWDVYSRQTLYEAATQDDGTETQMSFGNGRVSSWRIIEEHIISNCSRRTEMYRTTGFAMLGFLFAGHLVRRSW
jgi:hypothetical protein